MARFDEDLYDFLKNVTVDELYESTKKAYGVEIKKVINEVKSEIKPAEIKKEPKETKVEKEADKETPNVDKLTQKEETKKTDEGKVPEKPAEVDTKDGKYQKQLTEERVLTTLSDEQVARDMAGKYPGGRVEKNDKGVFVVYVAEAKKVVESETKIETDTKTVTVSDNEVKITDKNTTVAPGEDLASEEVKPEGAIESPDAEEDFETEEEEVDESKCKCGKNDACKCDGEKKRHRKGKGLASKADARRAAMNDSKVNEKKCPKCGKPQKEDTDGDMKYCQGHGIGEKKSVKESKDDFTWGFAKSVQAALKQHNFTPSLEKVGDFLAKLPEPDLNSVKMAIIDNDKNIIALAMNSIATGAPFAMPAIPEAPVTPETQITPEKPVSQETQSDEELMNKEQMANKVPMGESKVKEDRYKSDEDIRSEFNNFKILDIRVKPSGQSGYIDIEFPEGEESVGGGTKDVSDGWIKYDSGKIAFDNWYPEDVYLKLVSAINNKLSGNNSARIKEANIPIAMDGAKNTNEPVNAHEEMETPAQETEEHQTEITPELAKELILATDLDPVADLVEFEKGLRVEMEHFESTQENKELVAKITADHIKEFKDTGKSYYDALLAMEEQLRQVEEPIQDENNISNETEENNIPTPNPAQYK